MPISVTFIVADKSFCMFKHRMILLLCIYIPTGLAPTRPPKSHVG